MSHEIHEQEEREEPNNSHEKVTNINLNKIEESEKVKVINIDFDDSEINNYYEFYFFVYSFKNKSEYESYKKASEKENLIFNESILPNKNLLLNDLRRKISYNEYLELIDIYNDNTPHLIEEVFQTLQKKEFMEYYSEFEGFGICLLTGIKGQHITNVQWICGIGKEDIQPPSDAVIVTDPTTGEPVIEVIITNPDDIDTVVVSTDSHDEIIPNENIISDNKTKLKFKYNPKLSKNLILKLINKRKQVSKPIKLRDTTTSSNANYSNIINQSNTTDILIKNNEKKSKDKFEEELKKIDELIKKIENNHPKSPLFWDKKDHLERLNGLLIEINELDKLIIDQEDKDKILNYKQLLTNYITYITSNSHELYTYNMAQILDVLNSNIIPIIKKTKGDNQTSIEYQKNMYQEIKRLEIILNSFDDMTLNQAGLSKNLLSQIKSRLTQGTKDVMLFQKTIFSHIKPELNKLQIFLNSQKNNPNYKKYKSGLSSNKIKEQISLL